MGGATTEGTAYTKCGCTETIIFCIAIVSGTLCSICSKTMMELKGEGIDGDIEVFQKPIFQTFGMFIGMMFALIMHVVCLVFKIPFPGYDFSTQPLPPANSVGSLLSFGTPSETDALLATTQQNGNGHGKGNTAAVAKPPDPNYTPIWMYFFIAIPAIFDLAATALCMMGLVYLDVSVYQLLRGSGIIFVALMKQNVLGDRLYKFQWIGVLLNVCAVVLVGATAILNSHEESHKVSPVEALLGVVLVLLGAFVQALQFVFEEKAFKMNVPAPPLLLIGMEGFWGTLLCLVVVYPLVYYLPGEDHGSYEDPFNTWHMFMHTSVIKWAFLVYFFVIFAYNFFAVLITFMLNSVWHAILDNFRPISIWSLDVFIFYVITKSGDFGEPWTRWSFVQLIGMFVLLYGTAIYNAPNDGSVKLRGEWYNLGFDYSHEYKEIEDAEIEDGEQDEEWQKRKEEFKRRSSSLSEHSPFTSVHTQALRGFGSPKI